MTLSWISTIYPNRLGSHIMDYSCHISPMIHHFPAISSWGDADCGGDISKVGDWMTAGWPDSWKVTFSNKTGQTHGEIRFRWFQMISWYKNMWSRPHRTELMMFIIIWYNCIFIIFKIFKSTARILTATHMWCWMRHSGQLSFRLGRMSAQGPVGAWIWGDLTLGNSALSQDPGFLALSRCTNVE